MLKNIVIGLILTLASTCNAQGQALAGQSLTYDRINFSVSVNRDVENDTVTAILFAQREGSDAARLADEINKEITRAVDLAKEVPEVKVQSHDYSTYPVYSKQTLTGWRVRQSISLETRDIAALSNLLGRLQQHLAIQSINYSVSPERRQAVEEQIIAEALTRFTERAKMVTQQFGRPEYRVVNLDISTGREQTVRPMARGPVMMSAESSVSPPSLEAGTDLVSVTVNGTIELQVR